jgi:hypothetical protein
MLFIYIYEFILYDSNHNHSGSANFSRLNPIKYKLKLLDLDIDKYYNNDKLYICPITYIKFCLGIKYIVCNTCNNHFHNSVYDDWVIKNSNCPHCRSEWKNNTIIYINNKCKN